MAWLRVALTVVGFAISIYLTAVHYDSHVPLVCSASGIIDCAAVVTSPQSVVLGVPLALWGVAWFAVAIALALWTIAGGGAAEGRLRPARLLWAALGAVSVIYFIYLELMVIGRICIWCSAVHLIVLILLGFEAIAPQTA